jgi:hypothetical protein
MMEASSTTPPPPAEPVAPAPIPWEDPARPGVIERFVETVKLLASKPAEAFDRMPTVGGIGQPLLFAIIVGWIGIAVSAIWMLLLGGMWLPFADKSQLGEVGAMFGFSTGLTIVMIVVAPILVIIGVFVQAVVLHLMLLIVGGATKGFEATTRVCSYAYAAQLAQIIPFCGGILAIAWSLILLVLGLAQAHSVSRGKAAVAVVLPLVLCCAFFAALMFMGVLAGVASSR